MAAYDKTLHTNLLQRDASGKMKFFTNSMFLLGFSDLQIQHVSGHCNELFSVSFVVWWRYWICSMHLKFMQSCKKYLKTSN